jgi:hypothetical protein
MLPFYVFRVARYSTELLGDLEFFELDPFRYRL